MNGIVARLSKLLNPADREFVCGDLTELHISPQRAAANILGLFARRQFQQWSHWEPWAALLGVGALSGFFLSDSVANLSTALFLQIRTYLVYGVTYEPGGVTPTQIVAFIAVGAMATALWFWACGFVLASLSGRALWITCTLFYCVVRDSWFTRMSLAGNIILKHSFLSNLLFSLLPLDPLSILLWIVFGFGIRSARKRPPGQMSLVLLAALGVASALLIGWMQSWFAIGFAHWSGQSYTPPALLYRALPIIAMAWPVLSLPLVNVAAGRNRVACQGTLR